MANKDHCKTDSSETNKTSETIKTAARLTQLKLLAKTAVKTYK